MSAPSGSSTFLRNKRSMAAAGTFAAGVAIGFGLGLTSTVGNGAGSDPFEKEAIWFPNDLGNIDHWIEFKAEETKGRAVGALESFIGQGSLVGNSITGGTIFLPMTNNLSTEYHPTYSTPDLQMAAGSVLKPFDRSLYGNNDIPGAAEFGGAMAGLGIAGLSQAIKGRTESIGKALGALGVDGNALGAAMKVFGGIAQNPHKIVLFTGVDFRDHTFSWKLSPRNREESNKIQKIIDMFTYYSHPEFVGGGLFFKYPEFFRIKFHHPEYLFELRPSVCTGIRVNYHTNGVPSYIRNADGTGDPAPSEVELSLTFKETEIITKQFLNPGEPIFEKPAAPNSPNLKPIATGSAVDGGFVGLNGETVSTPVYTTNGS